MSDDILLKVVNVSKSFSGVKALDGVSLTLKRGTVHALCGENGAGKSTLMNILIGLFRKDSGEILFKGEKVDFLLPKQALDAGISIIEQELSPIYDMTVAENVFLGREPVKSGLINHGLLNQMTTEILDKLDIKLNPERKMKTLSLAEMQLVEIAKAISYDTDVLIMDEPTSAIGEKEVEKLFQIIRLMKADGKGILYISHRLKEVFTIADEVTVFRDGRYIATEPISETDPAKLVSMMIGRKAEEDFVKETHPLGPPLLAVANFSKQGQFQNISLNLRHGEVLGIFGLMGSGRSEFLNALYGMEQPDCGEVIIDNQMVKIGSPNDALKHRVALVSEDRKKVGLVLTMPVKENITLASLRQFLRGLFINDNKEKHQAKEIVKKFGIKASGLGHIVRNLSGGNQQKVVIGRCFLTSPRILLLDEPTRGIDVGAKREIYKFISDYTKEGNGVVMVSSELPEILSMSDRIIIFKNGKIAGEFARGEADQETVLRAAF